MTICKTARHAGLTTLVAAGMLAATPASALNIVLNDIGGVTGTNAEAGFKIAALYWSSVITNPGTIRFDVGFSDLGPNVLGSTNTTLGIVPISSYFNALQSTQNSALDAQAVANLSPLSSTGSVDIRVPGYLDPITGAGIDNDAPGRFAPDGSPISQQVALASANIKAFTGSNDISSADARIRFSSTFNFDFNPDDGVTTGSYDFVGVAIHEMGHALGFISGADDFDYSHGYAGSDVDDSWWAYGLDMFRYADSRKGPTLNIEPGKDAYFSVDGGKSAFMNGYFSTGTDHGDGWQASHWKAPSVAPFCSGLLGSMNPYVCNARQTIVTALDLAAFDAIGWNLNIDVLQNPNYARTSGSIFAQFASAVPEPATWAQMMLGFGLLGSLMRRRKAKVAVRFGGSTLATGQQF